VILVNETLGSVSPQGPVLCETDGPYARRAGKPCQPADLPALVESLAHLWDLSPDRARRQIHANQQRLTCEDISTTT